MCTFQIITYVVLHKSSTLIYGMYDIYDEYKMMYKYRDQVQFYIYL